MLLDIRHVYKDYNQENLIIPVLKDINISVDNGEYVAIMGPSGSGKTTLMNIIGCLDLPTSGEFLLDGEDVLKLSERELANLRLNQIGFVFQNFHLMQKETAVSNVALPLVYSGIKKQERIERSEKVLTKVGLEDRFGFLPNQLSGGQKQRVAIARAIVNNPKLLLADEPTGALDSASGQQVMEVFKRLNDEGVTILMITHDENVASNAKRIIRIVDGRVF